VPLNFIAGDEADQGFLLPPDVRDWLPADDLAWLVLEVVDQLDLSDFYVRYRANGQGKAAFHPAVMLAVLIYAHARGIRSSRQIERMCVRDVGFRVLARNLRPDHATIARFVVRHEEDLEGLFAKALRLCAAVGLVDLGVIAIDGTKIAASASWSANKTEAALGHLVAEQQALLTEAQAAALAGALLAEQTRIDTAEDAVHGAARGDELPAELSRPAERLKRLQAANARLVEERETAEKAQQAKLEAYQQRKERGGRLGARPLDKPRGPASG
jgi:transposase